MTKSPLVLSHKIFTNEMKIHPILHAKNIDRALGYRISKIEVKLLQKYRAYDRYNDDSNRKQHYKGTQTWIGLHPQILQTPYCDIYNALSLLNSEKIKHVVDIGAAYGRVGLVLSVINPKAKFTGYEIVKQRQTEGNRIFEKLGIENSLIKRENVLDSDFSLPDADVYFIYDFSTQEDVFHILYGLSKKVHKKKFYLIARGDRADHLLKRKFGHVWNQCLKVDESDFKIYRSIHSEEL